ncbi:MAG: transporter [Planctomycetaceae bacterium]|nr:transporter [Planctomycetaceae bacterium]
MNRLRIHSMLCRLAFCAIICYPDFLYADSEPVLFEQSLLGKTQEETGEEECRICIRKGLFFSPECGTLFQWSEGTGCSGGPQLDEPLQTDRPNFTSTSVTVGKGVTQIEFGYTYADDSPAGQQVSYQSFGEFLYRRGIFADWLEFRLGFSPTQQTEESGSFQNTTVGSQDLYTALQFALTPQSGILPESALIVQMSLPTGSTAFTANQIEPGVDWIYAWELNDFFSISGSTQGNRSLDDNNQSFLEMAQSLNVNYSLTKQLSAFTEWFALIPCGSNTEQTEHYFDAGFTYLINNNLQLDLSAGVGLNEAAVDYFVGAGCSIRFP